IAQPTDRRHHSALSRDCEFDGHATDCVGLLEVGLGCNVACRPLEVVRESPMALVAKPCRYQAGDERCNATQLRMAKSVLGARSREKLTVRSPDPFRHGDHAVAVTLLSLLHLRQKPRLIERHLGKQQDVWRHVVLISSKRTGGGCPACMPS